ncbi:unnamed protein product, partial [Hymenolepis diminuta]
FTFSSSHNYPDEEDVANKQTATISTSISAKESGDTNEEKTTSNRQALEGIDNPDGDYTSKVESWRKVSSARMYARTVPNLSPSKRTPQREKQVQKRHAVPSEENRRHCRSLLTPKVLQSVDISEICEPVVLNYASGEKSRYNQMQSHTRDSTSSSNSSMSRTQNVIPRPTKLLIAKSDSDSGVNTQPEDTPINISPNRPRIHSPMTPTTNQPRWLVNRSASRIEDSRRRPMSSSHQQHFRQRRSD